MQFPVKLAWACTVNKVQKLTLENVVISSNLIKQRAFNYGKNYVALSPSTSFQDMHILGQIENRHVKANPNVSEEYQRLRNECTISRSTTLLPNDVNVFTISLLNIRSLKKNDLILNLIRDFSIVMS